MKIFTKDLIDISFKTTNKTFNFIILFCFISAVSKDDNIIARGRREAVCTYLSIFNTFNGSDAFARYKLHHYHGNS